MKLFLDLDGTLLDCRHRLHGVFVDLTGCEDISVDEYWELKREPRSHESILSERFGWTAERIARFKANWLSRIEAPEALLRNRCYDHTRTALDMLEQKATLFVLTARQDAAAAKQEIEMLGLAPYFDQVIATGLRRDKAQAVRDAGILLERRDALVGDTAQDIAAARDLGIESIAVEGGFRKGDYLRKCAPDHIYSDILDFAKRHFRGNDQHSRQG